MDEIMEQVPAYRDRWMGGSDKDRAAVRRMFERDKDELRRLGIPLETHPCRTDGGEEADGYLIPRGDFYFPYLRLVTGENADPDPLSGAADGRRPRSGYTVGEVELSEEEAQTAILALRTVLTLPSFPFQEVRRALGKLTFDLDPALAGAGEDQEGDAGEGERPPIRILDRPGGADPEGALPVLLDGLHDRHRVRFRYHSIGRDAVERRTVEPWGLLFQWGAWYLAARDTEREDGEPRLFRVDRMREANRVGSRSRGADFQVPDDFDVRALGGRKAWELGKEDEPAREVVVRFLPPSSLLAARNGWGEPLDEDGEEEEDGSVLQVFAVRRTGPFVRWILSFAGRAEVVSPPDVEDAVRAEAARILELYREDE